MPTRHHLAGSAGRAPLRQRLAASLPLLWSDTAARKYSAQCAAVALGLAAMVAAGPACADVYAYGTQSPFQGGNGEFGIVDLTTGTFQQVAQSPGSINGGHVAGLVMGPNNVLYSADEYSGNELWTVNPASGATTFVGTMNTISPSGDSSFGSTNSATYLTDRAGNFYQVNPSNAHLTYIANLGSIDGIGPLLSTDSATLYSALGATLYTVNTTTGATTLIGTPSIKGSTAYDWTAITEVDGILYGSIYAPYPISPITPGGIYTIDTGNDTATYVGGSAVFWGLAPESSGSSTVPEPATSVLLLAGLAGLGVARRTIRT